jgi:hypothetical protein
VIIEDSPSMFFWQYNYNVDYKNNLWVTDKEKHSIFYISKEKKSSNAIIKVTGSDYMEGARDGNIM